MTRYIYALLDPDTDEVRYIGQTINPAMRYEAHRYRTSKPASRKDFWVNSLAAIGKQPKFHILEEDADFNAETKWILHYHKQGAPLTNGTGIDDQTTVRVSKSVKAKVLDFIKKENARTNSAIYLSDVVNAAIEAYLESHESEEK